MRNETPVDRMIPFLIQFETNGVNQIFKRKTKEKKKKKIEENPFSKEILK